MRRLPALILVAACAEYHAAERPPPHDADPIEAADAERSAAVDAAADRVAAPTRPLDADLSATAGKSDAGTSAAPDISPGALPPLVCPTESVSIHAESPFGALLVTQLGVSYWDGFTSGTALFARAEAAGKELEIRAAVYTLRFDGGPAPTGEYVLRDGASDFNELSVTARNAEKWLDIHNAELRIDRHDAPSPPDVLREGALVRFEGTLTISDPGWSLALPFSIDRACEFAVAL